MKVYDRIYVDGYVVLGDNRLGRKVHHVFLERHLLCHLVDEGHLKVKSRLPRYSVRPQPLNDKGVGLGNDSDVADNEPQEDNNDNQYDNRVEINNETSGMKISFRFLKLFYD